MYTFTFASILIHPTFSLFDGYVAETIQPYALTPAHATYRLARLFMKPLYRGSYGFTL